MRDDQVDFFTRRNAARIPGLLVLLVFFYFKSAHERVVRMYNETLKLRYFLEDTVMRMINENIIGIVASILIIAVFVRFWKEKTRKQYFKKFVIGYIIVLLVVLSGLPVRRDTYYELNNSRMKNVQVLYYCIKDMIEDECVSFSNEPCEYRYETVAYFVDSKEYFPYLCMEGQGDMIPLPKEYSSEIKSIVKESEGICDIICYKNTHIIKAINGVELIDLK